MSQWLSQRAVTDTLTASFHKMLYTSADVKWGRFKINYCVGVMKTP
jgi:hypothetical protein